MPYPGRIRVPSHGQGHMAQNKRLNIHSFRLFLKRLVKSTTAQRCSQHSMDSVSEFQVKAPQANASEGLPQSPYVAARARFKSTTFWMKGVYSTNKPPRPTTV